MTDRRKSRMRTMSRKKLTVLAGMVSVVAVAAVSMGVIAATASEDQPSAGPIPKSAWRENGGLDRTQVPDFSPVRRQKVGLVGYSARDDVLPQPGFQRQSSGTPADPPTD